MKFLRALLLLSFGLLLTSCTKKVYTIYVNYGNEFELEEQKIKNYSDINKLEIPNMIGYIPNGWFIDSSLKTPLTENTPLKDITVIYLKRTESDESKEDLFFSIYNEALINHQNSSNYEVLTKGNAKTTFADQVIYSVKTINDDQIYLYNSSYGIYAKTFVELKTENNIYVLTKGEPNINFEIKNINYEKEVTLQEYLDVYGVSPFDLNYLINENTLKEVKKIESNTSGYTFIIELKDEAALEYKKYIIGNNNLASENVRFQNINLIININSDLYFKSIIYDETYKIDIKLAIVKTTQTITNKITDTFTYINKKDDE